jgi:hypothetical protein
MKIECKKCKEDLTRMAIKVLEGKVERVICSCQKRDEIAKEFGLYGE